MVFFFLLVLCFARGGLSAGPDDQVEALEAYDCSGEVSDVSTISLNEVKECDEEPTYLESNQTIEVQLLQDSPNIVVDVSTCRLSISRMIHHCGMHSHSSTVQAGMATYVVELGRSACLDAVETRRVRWSGTILDGLSLGKETHSLQTIAGSVTSGGKCEGSSYSDQFGSWSGVVVQAEIKMFIDRYSTTANIRTGDITIRGGLRCEWDSQSCFDNMAGETYWRKKEDGACPEKSFDVLYQGPAVRVSSLRLGTTHHMYHISAGDFQFVTQSGHQDYLCHQAVYRTDHPRLYIQERPAPGFYFKKKSLQVRNTDLMQYTNAKLTLLEHHFEEQLGQLYQKLRLDTCLAQRTALQNKLSLLKLKGSHGGQHSLGGRGTKTIVAGEVAHVIRCRRVRVTTRPSSECYAELPVTYGEKAGCILPISRIIVPHCTPTPCSDIIPQKWKIGRRWISLDPKPRVTLPPVVLDPAGKTKWEYKPLRELSIAGIYSTSQLEQTQDVIMNSHTREVVSSIISGRVTGHDPDDQKLAMSRVIPMEQLRASMSEAFGTLTAWVLEAGSAFGAVMLAYYTYQAGKTILSAVLNFKMMREMKGCSAWLFTAPCSVVTLWLQHRSRSSAGKEESCIGMVSEAGPEESRLVHPATIPGAVKVYPNVPEQ
ncbi:glycoprotein [Wenzhou crab virus 2]|uniref:Glycoprotein n=1 Tax=Wenzhou crab virus 2 TaxID=1608092 RepID=A0A0B5KRA9_9VIRU|nr:glycoprotein [Wenzhou crab virus 2]AJG39061.1 glycoprotein [Wenzhou crab virus 2]